MKYFIHHISRTLIFRFGDVYHSPSPGISNTDFSCSTVQSWAIFRIGYSSNEVQSNEIRSEASLRKFLFREKIPEEGQIQSRTYPRRRPDSVSNLWRILGIEVVYSINVLGCRSDFQIPAHTEIRPCFVFNWFVFKFFLFIIIRSYLSRPSGERQDRTGSNPRILSRWTRS